MSDCFKLLIFWIFLLSGFFMNAEADVLRESILKFNNIKDKVSSSKKIDSSTLILGTDITKVYPNTKYSFHIIKKRVQSNNILFFIVCLIFILLISWIRVGLTISFSNQIRNFTKLKYKASDNYSGYIVVLVNLLFIFLSVFILSVFYLDSKTSVSSVLISPIALVIFICLCLYIVYRYILGWMVQYIFNQKQLINKLNYYWIDLIFIYLCVTLPLVLISSLTNFYSEHFIYHLILYLFLFMYLISFLKLLYNEMNNLKTSVVKYMIYFYIVEFIPLVLLMKFLRNNFLIS